MAVAGIGRRTRRSGTAIAVGAANLAGRTLTMALAALIRAYVAASLAGVLIVVDGNRMSGGATAGRAAPVIGSR